MTGISKTYKLATGPKHPPIDEYAEQCKQQFHRLLEANPCEPEVQSFLQKHPWLVPGHQRPSGLPGHYPLHGSLIAQPKLPGQESYIPDLMWIATDSEAWFPTLIEIERPDKKIFNQDGSPSANFTRARNQLAQWRSWFNDPTNVDQFIDLYGISGRMGWRMMRLRMILIYGRRSEFEDDPKLTRLRGSLLPGQDEELMSFDRLEPDTFMRDAITAKAVGRGKYQALWVPPVFATGPGPVLANRLLHIEGIPEAIDRNPEIDEDRKDFLKQRIGYWKDQASSLGSGIYSVGDRE